jgi:carboxyl-terminal processing protease
MRQILTITALACVLGLASNGMVGGIDASENIVPIEELAPTAEHQRATRAILNLMRRYHYRKVKVDDALSEQAFDRYLKWLDTSRSVLLASDVKEFEKYRRKLDDALRFGKLKPAFEIFRRFRMRMEERTEWAQSLVAREFDFTIDESYNVERKDLPWQVDKAGLDELWRLRVKNDVLELRLIGRDTEQIRDTLTKRYARMSRRITQLDANDVYQSFVNAYTQSVEPHSSYFSPRTAENFDIRMKLSLQGIGAALLSENEYIVVRRIITGGPAALSKKLHVDDRIIGVGQGDDPIVDVVSWRLEDVVDLIRGPKDSVVRLQIIPGKGFPSAPPETLSLVRATVKLLERAAKKSIVNVGEGPNTVKVGVIDLPTFYHDSEGRRKGLTDYRSTTRDVRRLVAELEAEKVAGIVVDLRGNSGGSLVESTELTGLFIKSGPIVQIKDSLGNTEVKEDSDPALVYQGPLAVLVDRWSASASEIFSAAIQDYQRGIIIGEPTFGKGTVQNLFSLDRRGGLGRLKVTIAQFFRINGEGTQHRGVVPDIRFQTGASEAQGERALDNALPWASIRPATYEPVEPPAGNFGQVRTRHEARIEHDPRFALLREEVAAQRVLRERTSLSLVESVRKGEWDTREKSRKGRATRLRKLLGQPEPAEETEKGDTHSTNNTRTNSDAPAKPGNDILLDETAKILIDAIELSKDHPVPTQKVAESHTS